MKKLTKTLSLVLVVAMVLSLCVIGAGATFTDNDKITKDYSEAVTIATDLGIVSGVGNNTFAPAGTFTRAQAAVILTKMTTGANAAAIAPTTQTFKDVPTSFWGYKYIEYAAQAGLVAGIGNGMFSPNATLNGYQWALMLLKVRGFDSTGMTAANWQMLTAKAYYGNSKFSSVAITNAVVTREAATQMAYDALFTAVTTTGTKVWGVTGSHPGEDGATITDYGWITQAPDVSSTLAYTVFGVTKDPASADSFGRPATAYTVKAYTASKNATVAASYGWSALTKAKTIANTPVATYTTAVTATELYSKLGSKAVIKAAGSAFATTTKAANTMFVGGATATSDVTVATNKAVLGGAGIVTEIYATATANEYIVVQIQPTLAKVTNVATTPASKVLGAYTTYQIANAGSYNVFTSKVSGEEADQVTITGTVAKNDWVMVYGASADEAYVTAAKLVTGKLTGFASSTNAYTIGGTSYVKSAAVAGTGVTTDFKAYNTEATYALDTYGNVVGSVTVTTPSNYVFVLSATASDYLNTTTNKITHVTEATVITTDGKLQTIKTTGSSAVDLDTVNADTNANNSAYGLYTYTVNTDGLYVLTMDSKVASPATPAGKVLTQIAKNDAVIGSEKAKSFCSGKTPSRRASGRGPTIAAITTAITAPTWICFATRSIRKCWIRLFGPAS